MFFFNVLKLIFFNYFFSFINKNCIFISVGLKGKKKIERGRREKKFKVSKFLMY